MTLLGSNEKNINEDKNGESIPRLETTEVVLVYYVVSIDYHLNSYILYIFAPIKSFGHLLEISTTNLIFLKTVNWKY